MFQNRFTTIFKSFVLFLLIYCSVVAKANSTLDSLLNVLKNQKQDTAQCNTLFEITSLLYDENNPEAKKYASQAIEKSILIAEPAYFNTALDYYSIVINKEQTSLQKLQFLDQLLARLSEKEAAKKSLVCIKKAMLLEKMDSTSGLINLFDKAKQLALQSNDTLTIIDVNVSIGLFYKEKSNHTLALDAFITALKLSEYSGNTEEIFPICINLGTVYEYILDLDKALELYKKAEKTVNITDNPNGVAIVYYKIGKALLKQSKFKEAQNYLEKVYNIHVQRNDRRGLIVSAGALSGICYIQKEYDCFLKWMKISMDNAEFTNDQQGLASTYSSYGKYYLEVKKDYPKALEYYKKNLALDLNKIQLSHMVLVYSQLYVLYEKIGDYKNAFESYRLYSTLNDSLYNSDNIKKQTELKLGYEFDKIQRQKEIENRAKENEQKLLIEKERQRRNFFIVVVILAILLLLLSYRSHRIKRKANILLEKQKLEIEEQKKIVDEKNKQINDSINYARHIQSSILPLEDELKNSFKSYVLYYKPKDIVSGDFYWHIALPEKVFFAIADCTGHGVPGSIMSMIGNILLNEIVMEKKIYEPANILNTLNKLVKLTLRQQGENLSNHVKDGMDISLCMFDKNSNKLVYSGANIPLYVVHPSGEIRVFKPDKNAIGGYTDDLNCFTQTEVIMEKNEWAYLFSDGIIDQFGGEKNKKYTIKRMKDLFLEMLLLTPGEKLKAIENAHITWQNNYEQTDDILLLGFELKN